MAEEAFADELAKRGISARRCHELDSISFKDDGIIEVQRQFSVTRDPRALDTTCPVGCDGAYSRIRKVPDSL